jgi:hypothetical protein
VSDEVERTVSESNHVPTADPAWACEECIRVLVRTERERAVLETWEEAAAMIPASTVWWKQMKERATRPSAAGQAHEEGA